MTQSGPEKSLPVLLASIRQSGLDGELVLEQNDGVRRLYWSQGNIIYLQSDVAGEQFGNYLLRQGILDFPALSELLANEERYRLGEKVVQWGMMSVEERDCHLLSLQEQVMIHALEHAVVSWTWNPGSMAVKLSEDLHFKLAHRTFIWSTFQEAHNLPDICDLLFERSTWKWEGRTNLLATLDDLPLNPTTAYALSFLGTEPISYATFCSLSRLPEEEAASLIVTLWTLGALTLTQGELPSVLPPAPDPAPQAPAPLEPLAFPPLAFTPLAAPGSGAPLPPLEATPFEPVDFTQLPLTETPEFLDFEPQTAALPPKPAPAPAAEAPALDGPGKARKLVTKARQLLLQDRTVEAIRCLEQSVQLEPEAGSAFEAWLLLGRLRMANPAWSTRSIDALQNASRLRPSAAEPWAAMGEVYFRKGFKANAVACFQRALELDPSVPIPPDVDLSEELPGPATPAASGSLFNRFKSILGRSEKN